MSDEFKCPAGGYHQWGAGRYGQMICVKCQPGQ